MIPHALADRDIVAASRTGSGKTLCYLIPMVERLYREKWSPLDNLGGLVILPTRELAVQVFEVLRSITENLELNIGLCIGGKNLKSEQDNLGRMNIVVCTPGRFLQHLDQSFGFTVDNLRCLVLDEADEILSHGFSNTIDQILERLPEGRQTMLFSATISKNVRSLMRLALHKPENVLLHEIKFNRKDLEHKLGLEGLTPAEKVKRMGNIYETPVNLKQYYMVTKTEDKIDFLFSFLKSHPNSKVLVFCSTAKQVRFIYESFKKLKPGNTLLELHGRQKQPKRMAIFFTYQEKKYATLVTTNLGARGLDFPVVDWVVQLDTPESVELYVHRIGRTARHKCSGKSLIFVSPSETKFVSNLKDSGIDISELKPNPKKMLTIKASLESILSENNELKYLAQRAFISYVKSVNQMSQKDVFDVRKIDTNKYAASMGLVQIPVLKFASDEPEEDKDNASEDMSAEDAEMASYASESENGSEDEPEPAPKVKKSKRKSSNGSDAEGDADAKKPKKARKTIDTDTKIPTKPTEEELPVVILHNTATATGVKVNKK